MNWAHLHLVLNHIPIMGVIFGLFTLGVAWIKSSKELEILSLGFFVLAAIVTIPVYFTGEPAEEVVEHLIGVAESVIEQHEEAAEVSFLITGILGSVALAGLVFFRNAQHIPHWFTTSILVLALVVGGSMAWTANLGGQIRHSEIRTVSIAATVQKENTGDLWKGETRRERHENETDKD